MRESRPSGMRAVHQAPPALATRVTTSPSPTPVWRKAATAPRARSAWVGERWMSSNTTAKLRPRRLSGTTFVETTVRRCGAPAWLGTSGTTTDSKLVSACSTPFSETTKSSRVRPRTAWPFLSTTATSTVTSSTCVSNVGWGAGGGAWAAWGAAPRRTRPRTGRARLFMSTTGYRLAWGGIKARAPRRRWLCLDRSRGRRCAPRRGSDRRAAPPRPRIARAAKRPAGRLTT